MKILNTNRDINIKIPKTFKGINDDITEILLKKRWYLKDEIYLYNLLKGLKGFMSGISIDYLRFLLLNDKIQNERETLKILYSDYARGITKPYIQRFKKQFLKPNLIKINQGAQEYKRLWFNNQEYRAKRFIDYIDIQ